MNTLCPHTLVTRDRSPVNLDEFVRCQVRARELYVEAGPPFGARIMQGCTDERSVPTQVVVHSEVACVWLDTNTSG